MRHNFGDGIVFDRDTSQPRERFRGRRRFKWPEEEKSTKKLSDSLKKYKFKSFNQIDENTNSKDKDKDNKIEEEKNENNDKDGNKDKFNIENGGIKDNSQIDNGKNDDEDLDNNKNNLNNNGQNMDEELSNNRNSKETQNAFVQVNFWNEMIEVERKNIILKYEEKENEMKFKISELLKNIQNIKSDNFKEILALKSKLNEKNEEINDLKNLNKTLKKQLEKIKDKVNSLNNQIEIMKRQNASNNININNNNEEDIDKDESINIKMNNRINMDESMNSNKNFVSDYFSKSALKQNEANNRYNNSILENERKEMNMYQKKDPTFVLLNKRINYKNKNKSNSIINNACRNNRYYFNKARNHSMILKIDRVEPNFCIKSSSYSNAGDKLRKTQSDFSIKAYNNLFKKYVKKKEKRLLSAKILSMKDIKDFSNINKSKFDKTFYKLKLN